MAHDKIKAAARRRMVPESLVTDVSRGLRRVLGL
jgi:hypothetical protein